MVVAKLLNYLSTSFFVNEEKIGVEIILFWKIFCQLLVKLFFNNFFLKFVIFVKF